MTYESLIRTEQYSPYQAEKADQDVWGQQERCKAMNAEDVFVLHRKRSKALGCSREANSGRAKGCCPAPVWNRDDCIGDRLKILLCCALRLVATWAIHFGAGSSY